MATRPFLAPEILQISSMDCGVAAVSCMLSGFGIDANYEKLREACQTQVDGTSINALEDICLGMGLDVCQHIVPPDLMVDAMESSVPLIALVEPSPGMVHFVTVWRRVRDWLQVMDPRGGRMWTKSTEFESSLLRHTQRMTHEEWREWFEVSTFRDALERSAQLLLSPALLESAAKPVLASADPRHVGALDAALRLVRTTARFASGKSAAWREDLFQRVFSAALQDAQNGLGLTDPTPTIPRATWSIRSNESTVFVQGAVVLAIATPDVERGAVVPQTDARPLDLGTRQRSSLLKNVLAILGPQTWSFIGWIFAAMAAIAVGSAIELLAYRTALDIPRLVTTPKMRIGASIAFISLFSILLGLEYGVAHGVNRLGRILEMKLRMRTLWSIARVNDEFIKSRPTSDLAYRAHALSMGALLLPSLSVVGTAIGDLIVTLVAIALLDVRYAIVMILGAGLFVITWLTTRTKLKEIDMRLQTHAWRLLNILLDGLRGIRPIRLHGFQDAFRDDQRRELDHWKKAAREVITSTSLLQARYSLLGVVMLSVTFIVFLVRHGDPRQFIILAFWSFRIPSIITRLVQFAQTYPLQRNAVDRLIEVTQYVTTSTDAEGKSEIKGVSIKMSDVSLMLGGHVVLEDIQLDIPQGQHVAVVGASGSGKSSLVGLLLGIHDPTSGVVLIDGRPIDGETRQTLRAETMWIDPTVQLWNDSVGANLDYASKGYARRPALQVLDDADLLGVLASVDRGLDAPLGAEGAFVSGGEGQRIRVGRALFRAETRLALLDEPFRGLDRSTRHQILLSIRRAAIRSTMVFVSHDISHAMSFDRVLVIDSGKIVEDGSPQELSTQDSAFARLLNAEKEMLDSAWSGRRWRKLRVEGGIVREADNRA
jgi:ATP-binding cassette subfamily B protein